jgi:hypothetical protein
VGINRWFVKPELGLSKALGPWTLELTTVGTFFGDNDDFLSGKRREQDPIYSVKGGPIYGFRNGIWVAANGTYFTGGRATVEGVGGDNLQKNSRGALRSRYRSTGTTRSSSTPPPGIASFVQIFTNVNTPRQFHRG